MGQPGRHRQAKGAGTDKLDLHHHATSRLYRHPIQSGPRPHHAIVTPPVHRETGRIAAALLLPIMAGWRWGGKVIESRRETFRRLAIHHRSGWLVVPIAGPERWPDLGAESAYHRRMAESYDFAARYPCLPVAPDPLEPR